MTTTTGATTSGTGRSPARPVDEAGGVASRRSRPGTGSRATRVLGVLALALGGLLALLALVLSPEDEAMGEVVRIFYVHVPSALASYLGVGILGVGSVAYLWKRSQFWDLLGAAAAEIGLVFTGLALVTGSLWGRPTWGTYWEWDPRLTSTAMLFLLLLGYVAVRSAGGDPHTRSRRAAVVGILAAVDVPIVRYSVDWWRSLHQPATLARLDPTIDGLMLFTAFVGMVTFAVVFLWLLVHRFRVAWLEEQVADVGLREALVERRAEAGR